MKWIGLALGALIIAGWMHRRRRVRDEDWMDVDA
jgi:hypothetical protein